ncbi:MAG TPA: helix-turn-helix domain-containing protein [Thermoanaerobaculia bacterium]|nr:helix-turn-helix domain-containing protein [Thermoanaerobaculia bacterium]
MDGGAGKRSAGRQPPWAKGGDAETGSFGTWLRRQRELREISLRSVADRTKISLRYLEAMEEDRFDLLPAPVFAKGFLREYARYVGLSPDEVVNHFLAVQQANGAAEGEEAPSAPGRHGKPGRESLRLWLALGVLLLLALATFLGFYLERHRKGAAGRRAAFPASNDSFAASPPAVPGAPGVTPARPEAPAPTAAKPQPVAGTAAASAAPLEVTLDFTQDCWVDVIIDGSKRISEQRVPGESLPISAREKVVLNLGNAPGVEIQVNGLPFPVPAGHGRVVRDLQIDLDTVRALREKKEAH